MSILDRRDILLEALKKVEKNGILAHSYLLNYDNQEIVDNFLNDWLEFLVCENKDGYNPCHQCISCKKWVKNNFLSIYHLKSNSKSGQILTNELQEFQGKFNFTSDEPIKIGIIYEADKMIFQAQNSFLKTLEEPPQKSLFILLTKNPTRLLQTILSRCQHILLPSKLKTFDTPECSQILDTLTHLHPRAGAEVAIRCAEEINSIFNQLFKSCEAKIADEEKGNSKNKLLVTTLYLQERQKLLSLMEVWFYQLFIQKVSPKQRVNYDFNNYYPKNFKWEFNDIQKCLNLFKILLKDYQSNINEKLALNNFCFQVCSL